MIDHAATDAHTSDRVHFRMLSDLSLAWIMGPPCAVPLVFNGDGALVLRRWKEKKYPFPAFAAAVGYELRPATVVARDGSATWPDGIWWHYVDVVSGGGVLAQREPRLARPAVWKDGAHVGLMPNAVNSLDVEQTDDRKARLSWMYNPLDQQVAPASFDVFSDGGSGTVDLDTPVDNVTYQDGRNWYYWKSGQLNDGDERLYMVRAKSSTGVYGLMPMVGSAQIGLIPSYVSCAARYAARIRIVASAPAAPAAPVFG